MGTWSITPNTGGARIDSNGEAFFPKNNSDSPITYRIVYDGGDYSCETEYVINSCQQTCLSSFTAVAGDYSNGLSFNAYDITDRTTPCGSIGKLYGNTDPLIITGICQNCNGEAVLPNVVFYKDGSPIPSADTGCGHWGIKTQSQQTNGVYSIQLFFTGIYTGVSQVDVRVFHPQDSSGELSIPFNGLKIAKPTIDVLCIIKDSTPTTVCNDWTSASKVAMKISFQTEYRGTQNTISLVPLDEKIVFGAPLVFNVGCLSGCISPPLFPCPCQASMLTWSYEDGSKSVTASIEKEQSNSDEIIKTANQVAYIDCNGMHCKYQDLYFITFKFLNVPDATETDLYKINFVKFNDCV